MSQSFTSEHEGIVTAPPTAAGIVLVRIDSERAGCGGCAASALCGAARGELLEAQADPAIPLQKGQRVRIAVSQNAHRISVLLMLVLPWLVMVATLVLLLNLTTMAEGIAVLIAFAATLLTYLLVTPLTRRLARRLRFRIIDTPEI